MRVLVGTTAQKLPGRSSRAPIVQNLGPGTIHMDSDPNVNAESGLRMPPGTVFEFPRAMTLSGGAVWVVADQPNTDLRMMNIG